MLEELSIHNYALIDSLSLSFQNRFTVLSGETGAGKSIIVGAISFLLGAKADSAVVRTGSDATLVQATISIRPENEDARNWLGSRNIEADDHRVIIRRTLKPSGRGSIYCNDVQITRTELAEFMAFLFDLHGQHTHESLLRPGTHRIYVDRFAGIEEEVAAYCRLFARYTEKKQNLEKMAESEQSRRNRREMLEYAAEEIDKAAVKKNESAALAIEAKRLADFEKLIEQTNVVCEFLLDTDESVLTLSRKTRSAFEQAAGIDEGLEKLAGRFKDWYYESEDIAAEMRSYRDSLHNNPERLAEVEERLALLFRLKKKYGPTEAAILEYRNQIAKELEELGRGAEDRSQIEEEIAALDAELDQKSAGISEKRKAAAAELGNRISDILALLGMPRSQFSAAVKKTNRGPFGSDEVEFLISTNVGEPLAELARIASGGELSRVMLAIKTVLSRTDTRETLIFDEIDTGIGGSVAHTIGTYLAGIGTFKQIFCVTHLASIAAQADNHLKVEKTDESGRMITHVSILDPESKRKEIARMLSGDTGTAALAHADALLARYREREEKGNR